MSIRPDEISAILRRQIENYEDEVEVSEVGTVLQVADGVATVYGLENCMASELLEFPGEVYGMALNLEHETIGAVILGNYLAIKEGDEVRRTGRIMEVPVGAALLGRVVNSLGQPLDRKGPINTGGETRIIDRKAPGVITREEVNRPLQTGWKAIDAMIPIGRGQRELIIGDRQTGKTTLVVDAILNQQDQNVICIYVAVGQKASTVAAVVDALERSGAMEYSTVVSATASQPSPMLYVAPYSGCAMGEEFMHQGKDVLVIYDDLTKHAWAYRELSLLLRRPPGREAYPGDVFYLHSRLLERAAKLNEDHGGGSLTALPIIETQAGDRSAYIPTNVISITDGQIYLETDLFYAGQRPAIDVGASVSRVGSAAQTGAMKAVARTLRMDLAQYQELEAFAQFGSDLDATTQAQLARGERTQEILKQGEHQPMSMEDQVAAIFLATEGYLDDIDVEEVGRMEGGFLEFLHSMHADILDEIRQSEELDDDIEERLAAAAETFKADFLSENEETAS